MAEIFPQSLSIYHYESQDRVTMDKIRGTVCLVETQRNITTTARLLNKFRLIGRGHMLDRLLRKMASNNNLKINLTVMGERTTADVANGTDLCIGISLYAKGLRAAGIIGNKHEDSMVHFEKGIYPKGYFRRFFSILISDTVADMQFAFAAMGVSLKIDNDTFSPFNRGDFYRKINWGKDFNRDSVIGRGIGYIFVAGILGGLTGLAYSFFYENYGFMRYAGVGFLSGIALPLLVCESYLLMRNMYRNFTFDSKFIQFIELFEKKVSDRQIKKAAGILNCIDDFNALGIILDKVHKDNHGRLIKKLSCYNSGSGGGISHGNGGSSWHVSGDSGSNDVIYWSD